MKMINRFVTMWCKRSCKRGTVLYLESLKYVHTNSVNRGRTHIPFETFEKVKGRWTFGDLTVKCALCYHPEQ